MEKEIKKMSFIALLTVGLYLLGVFNKFSMLSLTVIIPLAIAFIIPLGRIIVMAFKKDKITDPE